jgi:hypothetical protein
MQRERSWTSNINTILASFSFNFDHVHFLVLNDYLNYNESWRIKMNVHVVEIEWKWNMTFRKVQFCYMWIAKVVNITFYSLFIVIKKIISKKKGSEMSSQKIKTKLEQTGTELGRNLNGNWIDGTNFKNILLIYKWINKNMYMFLIYLSCGPILVKFWFKFHTVILIFKKSLMGLIEPNIK